MAAAADNPVELSAQAGAKVCSQSDQHLTGGLGRSGRVGERRR